MFSFSLLLSFFLFLSTSLCVALPTGSEALSSLAPRTLYCANAPGVEAGSLLSRDLLHQIPPTTLSKRAQTKTRPYCAHLSRTYVVATLLTQFTPATGPASMAAADLLIDAENFLKQYVVTMGDKIIAGGRFDWPGNEHLTFRAWNANNHQLTYGVLAAGLQALQVWAWGEGWGTLKFKVYDGRYWVGEGVLELPKIGG